MPEEKKNDRAGEAKIDPPSLQNHSGKVIVPISEQTTITENKEVDDNEKSTQTETVESTEIKKEALGFTDLNVNSSINNVTNAKEDMQQPRIYDTKQYYVPINDTKHKHGFIVGTIIAGLVTAILVVGLIAIFSLSA